MRNHYTRGLTDLVEFHEALYYTQLDNSLVKCNLCPNLCVIKPGKKGKCNARKNIDGKLFTLNYGLSTSGSRDPIEKKPLYHFQPGTCAYSFGTVGCNLFCQFCQNWHISRADPEEMQYGVSYLSPEKAVQQAKKSSCPSVAYTYNEPFVWYEWVYDTAKLMKKNGVKNVLVTNGYVEEAPLRSLLPFIDAANVDLKGDSQFYKEMCLVSHREAVLRTCKIMKELGVHIEVTNLIVTSKNDTKEQLQELIDFVLHELGPEIPLHFSRYYPQYNVDLPPTPIDTLLLARDMAIESGLKYVYLGHVRDREYSNTYCKTCGELLIKRTGYSTQLVNLSKDKLCKKCQDPNYFVW